MKFLNSFLFVVFLLFAICAVLCFAKPNGSTNKVPIQLKFFEHKADSSRCANCDYQNHYHDKSKVRFLLKQVTENSQDDDKNNTIRNVKDQRRQDDLHTIRYVFGERHEHDALVVSSYQYGPPSSSYPTNNLLWRCPNSNSGKSSLEITAIELNVTQTSRLGKAYLIPERNQFDLYVEQVNGKVLRHGLNVYGYCILQDWMNNDDDDDYYY